MAPLFSKQFSRKELSIKQRAPLEVCSKKSVDCFKQLLAIDGLLRIHIAPYLRSKDLLRLSSASHELCLPCKEVVMSMCVRRRVNASGAINAIPTLPNLKFLDISFIELSPSDYANLLNAAKAPHSQGLRVLRLRQRGTYPPSPIPKDRDVNLLRLLSAAINLKAWPHLEDLDLSGNGIGDTGLNIVVTWIKGINKRRLKRLGLSFTNISERGMLQLLNVLAKGYCPIMMKLDLSLNGVEFAGVEADASTRGIMWAKAFCTMPLLSDLDLRDSGFEGDVTRGLAKAFTRLKQSKFRRISLGGCSLTDEDVEPFFRALGEGVCPYLSDLNIREACLGRESFTSLASLLSAKRLHNIRRLDIADNLLSYEAMQDIITALQTGCAPRLEYLNLSSTGSEFEEVNEMARLWKKKLREDGHCPHLRDSDEEERR